MSEIRNVNISFGKNGNGYASTRITLPVPWIKEMGFTEDDRNAVIEFNENEIIIRKKGEINMKLENILNLKVEDFEKMLTEEEKEYVTKENKCDYWTSMNLFLEKYQDGAKLSNQDKYVDIHEYIELLKEQDSWGE